MDLRQLQRDFGGLAVSEIEHFFCCFGVVKPGILFHFAPFLTHPGAALDLVKLTQAIGVQDFKNRLAAFAAKGFFRQQNRLWRAVVAAVLAGSFHRDRADDFFFENSGCSHLYWCKRSKNQALPFSIRFQYMKGNPYFFNSHML